jgi:hypothetical protein
MLFLQSTDTIDWTTMRDNRDLRLITLAEPDEYRLKADEHIKLSFQETVLFAILSIICIIFCSSTGYASNNSYYIVWRLFVLTIQIELHHWHWQMVN